MIKRDEFLALDNIELSNKPNTDNNYYQWQDLLDMILSYRSQLIKANIIAILGALASVPIPLLIPLLVDEVLLNQPGTTVASINAIFPEQWHGPALYIIAVTVLTLLLRLLSLVFAVWQTKHFTCIAKQVIFKIRKTLLHRLERVSMKEYETLGSGYVASHLVTDLDALDEFISISTSKFLVAVLSIIGTAIVLLWMHWQLALFILLLNPAVIYVTTLFGHKVKQLKSHENSAFQLFQEALEETLDAIGQIRAANQEKHYISRLISQASDIRTHSSAFAWKSDTAGRLSFVIFMFGFDIFRAISMFLVVYSSLTIGEMMAVFAYLWFMMNPVQEVLAIQYAFHTAEAALQRINRLASIKTEPQYPHLKNPFTEQITTAIDLNNISFSYDNDTAIIKDVTLHIPAGQKVAFVGASGGGKTTLVNLILGLYVPSHGSILFDAVNVTEIGLDVVRDNIATVLQHPALFNDTVRNNLTLGKPQTDEALWEALDIAQLKSTIKAMPEKLNTIVGRSGVRLSGGQRQRLAIARMILSNPRIVILDEATSALDIQTESRLHIAMNKFLKHRTTIIIAHRLSAVKQADRVLVFEDGHIVEDGHHSDLINNNGLFATLYKQHTSHDAE